MTKKFLISASTFFCLFIAVGCMTMPTPAPLPTKTDNTISHRYGEEILAYMMQVVLGQAGDPDRREKWQSRGLDQPLDLEHIAAIMSDPGGNKTALMVNDANILGLLKVLYHYSPEMSQFSGSYGTSLYPAAELVALRLFLLKRLQGGRSVSIESLLDHRQLLTTSRPPTRKELAAMDLDQEEALLLQSVFNSKPWLFGSLTNPFLVDAFSRIGVLEKDPLTEKLIAGATYRGALPNGPHGQDSVVIALLPSITKEFIPAGSRFTPSATYSAVVEHLKNEIVRACRRLALQAVEETPAISAVAANGILERKLDRLIEDGVSFQVLDDRPLVIYPENAAKAIRETCPAADFTVIILGRNVYQSMHIDPAADIYPTANRLYLDITDIKHGQAASEIMEIGEFVYKKLKYRLAAALAEGKAS